MLMAIGEGEFEGTPTARDIYLDNAALQDPQGNRNFPRVKWEWRTGAVDQTYIRGIPSIENETTISTELRSGTPRVRAISNTQLFAVRVRFAWPALQSVDASNNINGYRIQYKVERASDGGAYQQVSSEAVAGKTTSLYERTRRIDLPKATAGGLMRIARLTNNLATHRPAIAPGNQPGGRRAIVARVNHLPFNHVARSSRRVTKRRLFCHLASGLGLGTGLTRALARQGRGIERGYLVASQAFCCDPWLYEKHGCTTHFTLSVLSSLSLLQAANPGSRHAEHLLV